MNRFGSVLAAIMVLGLAMLIQTAGTDTATAQTTKGATRVPAAATAPASAPASMPAADVGVAPGPDRVLVIYNEKWQGDSDFDGVQDSLEVAKYYMEKRGIPAKNLLGLKCSTGDGYRANQYEMYFDEVIAPIKAKLDELGADKIDILQMCCGLPMVFTRTMPGMKGQGQTISIDNDLMALTLWTRENGNHPAYQNPYLGMKPTFEPDKGHFSHAKYKIMGKDMYLVTRLEGPLGAWGAMDMIDRARYADRYFAEEDGYFKGNFYIDARKLARNEPHDVKWLSEQQFVKTGMYHSYESADLNISYAASYLTGRNFTLKYENASGATIGQKDLKFSDGTSAETAPNAFFYGGWYNINNYKDVFEWIPGAIACDLNSGSLTHYHMRNGWSLSWGPRALYRGVTCVLGVVDEPYVNGHPRPNVACYYLLKGYNFAEIAGTSTPMISWMAMHAGDGLYQPLRKGKELVKDKTAPVLAEGFPKTAQSENRGAEVIAEILDKPEPEVAHLKVEFGTTAKYGRSMDWPHGYSRHFRMVFPDLEPKTEYHYRLVLTDPAGNVTTTKDATFTSAAEAPLGGKPAAIPGIVQAENFDTGGEGVAYHDSDPENTSPKWQYRKETGVEIYPSGAPSGAPSMVVSTAAGEWLKYTVEVAKTGAYDIDVACNANWGAGGTLHIEFDGKDVTGPIELDETAPKEKDVWGLVTKQNVQLQAGTHVMKVCLDTNSKSGFSPLNYYIIRPAGEFLPGLPTPASGPASAPASKPAPTAAPTR